MTQTQRTVGIDCGKHFLDAAVFPSGESTHVPNTAEGDKTLREWIMSHQVQVVGMEASGGYERPIRDVSCAAGLTVHVFNPARVRYFAKAKGRFAKNDRIDARLIVEFTATLGQGLEPTSPDPAREEMAGLVRARRRMVDTRCDLYKVRDAAPEAARKAFSDVIDTLATTIKTLEAVIKERREANDALDRKITDLCSAPGIGTVTATTLAACVPELGQTSNAKIAALLGMAPFDADSGDHHGLRRIMGGRAEARHALYMAALVAATHVPGAIADFYANLVTRGKPRKVALTACMRKLIVRLNVTLSKGQTWQAKPA